MFCNSGCLSSRPDLPQNGSAESYAKNVICIALDGPSRFTLIG